ncbi:Rha family transcriptional regulator [Pseudomonas sp. MAP12]|uniref:Rha family transcriptional regulator n=1 Tax=Geopseudomonas aromaticivorans TaxID=2849492 RepID=A0ABS6MT87_9GAMM|nr:phage regulatory CII family protein [Pseudomonas aromaticivorans]MBV2132028.1 Rha family transcriptional regulator [Pseudomonas aromaticivorans]
MDEFLKAIHDAVIDVGAKELARNMGVSHVALLQRANPNNDAHRLNVEQLFQILLHGGDMRPLHALAAEFGFELAAKDKAEPKSLAAALLHMTKEVADVTRAVADALDDGHVSQTEEAMISREIGHVRESLNVLEESVKAA